MSYYTKILPRENKKRLDKLAVFRELVIEYFNNSHAEWMDNERIEQPRAEEARVEINRMSDTIHATILYAGINPSIRYTPPPAVGGYIQNIDLVQNIFSLQRFQVGPKYLLDFIDRAIGIYENNARPAFLRSMNPFFYLGLVFDLVAGVPFALIGRAGFNRKKAEASLAGRMIKGTIYIITALASLLTVLQLLDFLEPVKKVAKSMFGSN